MNIATWIIQVLLGILFLLAGSFKAFTPVAELGAAEGMDWVNAFPAWVTKLAAFSEILGGLGLILPSALRIQPKLTVYAAYGLVLVMVLAAALHISRGEPFIPNIVLGGLAGFVAWSRTSKVPIAPKS